MKAESDERPVAQTHCRVYVDLECLAQAAFVLDIDTLRVTQVNRRGCELLREDMVNVVGRSLATSFFAPSWSQLARGLREPDAMPTTIPATLLTADGGTVRVSLAAARAEVEGNSFLLLLLSPPEGYREEEPASSSAAARLRAMLDAIFDGYYDWHIKTGYNYFSEEIDTFLGLEPHAFPRNVDAWKDRLHPDDAERTIDNLYRCVETQAPMYLDEYRLRREDGEYVWVSDRGIVLYDDAGDPTHMVGVMKDVTQERAAEAAIRESAEIYGTLFRRATNPAFHVDGSGRFIDANAAFLRVLDMTEADVLKRKCSDILPPTLCRALERSSEPDERAPILETEVCGRGQPRHLMVTIVPCKVGDRFTRFGLCTDITDHHTMRTDLELSRASLREQAVSLEERNVALRVILDQRAQDRVDLERTIAQNLETMVEPVITRLLARLGKTPEGIQLETIRQSIREITHPARRLGGSSLAEVQLTPREVEIVNLTRLGKSSEQMAVVLFLSPATIAYHRQNIRRKLGLLGKSTRLSSYLAVTHA